MYVCICFIFIIIYICIHILFIDVYSIYMCIYICVCDYVCVVICAIVLPPSATPSGVCESQARGPYEIPDADLGGERFETIQRAWNRFCTSGFILGKSSGQENHRSLCISNTWN